MTADDIIYAISRHCFPHSVYTLAPNISWGLGLHECDLLAMTKARCLHEIEIKISLADLKRDALKRHHHQSSIIRYLWFAFPEKMKEKALPFIPDGAGIILVRDDEDGKFRAWRERAARGRRNARPLDDGEYMTFLRLLGYRYWSNRETMHKLKRQIQCMQRQGAEIPR
jgi:hypothetical protein